ncbi:MAG: VIT and vWA domain-containing protein [Pyrinomonadaceae bacterium]
MKIFNAQTQSCEEKLTTDNHRFTQIEDLKNPSLSVLICGLNFLKSLRLCTFALNFFLAFSVSFAQSGVLIPSSQTDKPDASVLSLQTMNVDILIDNQHATVKIMQIFDNQTANTLEGKYLFALSPQSSIFDFAVWDNDTRIPGVMMEKRRANAIYSQIKQAQIDPGILQQTDEHEGNSAFSAKVFPIDGYGSKRLELEYTEVLPVESLSSHFTFPLKPSFGETQTVGEFNLHLRVVNDFPIFTTTYYDYPLQITKANANNLEAEFHARNIELKDDFSFDYQINAPESSLSFITYRAPEQISAYDLRDPQLANPNPDGYFQAQAIFNQQTSKITEPRRIVLLLDTSLSMYGDKLARAVEAADYFLHGLTAQDKFSLILFNEETDAFSEKPLAATTENVEQAMQFVRDSAFGGGTNVKKALQKAIEQANNFSDGERDIILISDANPTLETTNFKPISSLFDNDKKYNENVIKLFAFAPGNDANTSLLEELTAKTHGYFSQARETEDIALSLKIFLDKIGSPSIENLRLNFSQPDNFYQIYATGADSFDGSSFAFVGRYKKPQAQTTVNFLAQFGAETINLSRETSLPEFDDAHPHLPRVWARARVDALLQAMNIEGEREDYIAEIIRLSEKYKFVTPYTAFLAAPRALLRPRLIQPGDPVIRVKTDASIKEVFAVLPFGETLPLKFLETEGVWETRFLAPAWMPDGTYRCRLLLTDKDGNGYQEEKTFVVDSHEPKLKINLPAQTVKAGDEILLKVSADSDTARIVAKFYGAKPVQLFWSNAEKANIGKLRVPENLTSGKYVLSVTAEDFAHNQTSEEISVEVL